MSEHYDNNKIVQQLLEVEAQVTVTPHINHGKPKIFCVKSDILPCCDSENFTVTQVIYVEIPITFDVDVDVDKGIVHCCEPDFGPCELKELPKPPNPHELMEPAMAPNLLNLLNLLNLINPSNLRIRTVIFTFFQIYF